MRLQALADAQAFLAAADELLSREEARHNLIYAACSTLIESPPAYEEAFFWTVEETDTLAALLRTPPFCVPDNVPGELREAEARERELAVNWDQHVPGRSARGGRAAP